MSFLMNIDEILKHLPHRYPLLLIDKVLELQPGGSIVALKNVTINEPFFPGHFPENPVMPGVIVIEALAQATAILSTATSQKMVPAGSMYYLAGIDNARFRKPVVPGDQIYLTAKLVYSKRNLLKFDTKATVNGQEICAAEIMGAYRKDK